MSALFVSYAQLYIEAKNALANRSWDSWFLQKTQNSRDMETMYTKIGNITGFIDWLKQKALEEVEGNSGALQFCVGGN